VLLECELLDRAQGIKLTPQGELVTSYARRLLSINDQIVHIGGAGPRPELVIRLGTSSDFVVSTLPGTLAGFRKRWPDVRFIVRTAYFDELVRELHSGSLDLFVGLSMSLPHDARHSWSQEVVWARGQTTTLDPSRPVPLVSYGEACLYHRLAVQVLKEAGLDWETVFTGPSMMSVTSAVMAGLGVMPIIRRRANDCGMIVWEDASLPKLPDLHIGIYIREGGARVAYEQLADEIAEVINPQAAAAPKLVRPVNARDSAA